MFITKITLSEEDKQSILELQHKCNELFLPIEKIRSEHMTPEQVQQANEAYFKVSRQLFDLREDIRRRYIAELSKDKAQALQNASEILDAYTIEDYRKEAREARTRALERIEEIESLLNDVPAYKENPDVQKEYNYWKIVRDTSGFNFTGAYHRLSTITVYEREALLLGEHGEKELDDLIYKKASSFYKPRGKDIRPPEPETSPIDKEEYMLRSIDGTIPFYNGPMTNLFASASTKGIQPERGGDIRITKQTGRSSFTYTLTSDDTGSKILSRLTPSTKKLFFRIIQTFTAANPYSPGSSTQLNPIVRINLKDFARVCRIPINEDPKTPAEAAKAETEFNNFRRKVKDNINILYRISVDGTEPGKGKDKSPDVRFRLLEHIDTRARGGCFSVELTRSFASYLANAYVLQGSEALYALPDTNPNSFPIGLKLSSHSSIRNNITQGTHEIIGVKTLLDAASDIQKYEALVATGNRNWKRCIREPLEAALEANVDCGVITEWYYCGSKGAKISDAELDSKSYPDFEALYIHFTMTGSKERLLNAGKKRTAGTEKKKRPRSKRS